MLSSASKTAPQTSDHILERFFRHRPHDKRLALTPAYFDMLAKLGDPHKKLPPVFHVAGTNGKGSTCAFLQAILEAAGYKVHVYTSPHLVRFHERIRIAGRLISEEELVDLLTECERIDGREQISDFEAATAVAFTTFARHPADFTILETGLGGRLDATNVVEKPLATLITRLSYDHRDYLGDALGQIAREKAGIMRGGVPCFSAMQPDAESADVLQTCADEIHAPLSAGGRNWFVRPNGDGFSFSDGIRTYDLPQPDLLGAHQCQNAGLAIAALSVLLKPVSIEAIKAGLRNVEWPARLQKLEQGALPKLLPLGWELWLDGGHNDSAGEVLSAQAKAWQMQDGAPSKPLYLIAGMLKTKVPAEFLVPLVPFVSAFHAVNISGEPAAFLAAELADRARAAGIQEVAISDEVRRAIMNIAKSEKQPGRILICGSLYLAGQVLRANGE